MPAAIENSVKEARYRNIMIIENQPQKEIAAPIIEVHKSFYSQNLEKSKVHVKHSASSSLRGCIMMKGKSSLITFRVQFAFLCFFAVPFLRFSLSWFYHACSDFQKISKDCRLQKYDDASNMMGRNAGV